MGRRKKKGKFSATLDNALGEQELELLEQVILGQRKTEPDPSVLPPSQKTEGKGPQDRQGACRPDANNETGAGDELPDQGPRGERGGCQVVNAASITATPGCITNQMPMPGETWRCDGILMYMVSFTDSTEDSMNVRYVNSGKRLRWSTALISMGQYLYRESQHTQYEAI